MLRSRFTLIGLFIATVLAQTPTSPSPDGLLDQTPAGSTFEQKIQKRATTTTTTIKCTKASNCPQDCNAVEGCSGGYCTYTCADGSAWSTAKSSCLPNQVCSCGASRSKCSGPISNGQAVCSNFACAIQCNANTQLVSTSKGYDCQPLNTVNSCGISGTKCPVPQYASAATCVSGVCGATCNSGYAYNSGTGTCVAQTNTGTGGYAACDAAYFKQYCSNPPDGATGVCIVLPWFSYRVCDYVCNTGYTQLSRSVVYGISGATVNVVCTDITSDESNCGKLGSVCKAPDSYSTAVCSNSVCDFTCNTGAVENAAGTGCVKYLASYDTDPLNCGGPGNACFVPLNGKATCTKAVCGLACNTGYAISTTQGGCALITTSAKARKRRSTSEAETLCPKGEQACPIPGASNFDEVVKQIGNNATSLQSGYECLDTSASIESCGGCTAMGQGENCLNKPHAAGVGCENGTCKVYSCKAGYALNKKTNVCEKKVKRSQKANRGAHAHHHARHASHGSNRIH